MQYYKVMTNRISRLRAVPGYCWPSQESLLDWLDWDAIALDRSELAKPDSPVGVYTFAGPDPVRLPIDLSYVDWQTGRQLSQHELASALEIVATLPHDISQRRRYREEGIDKLLANVVVSVGPVVAGIAGRHDQLDAQLIMTRPAIMRRLHGPELQAILMR